MASIVGTNAAVVKDLAPRSIVADVPARITRGNLKISDDEQI
jgi:acetyltransferase-like isoleucine patch superfamily enzyme